MPKSSLESLFILPPNDRRKTFAEDNNLPSLPVPDLKHTLCRYLDSVKPFVTAEEYKRAVDVVDKFERGEGRLLHEKLKKKSEKERNWVERWWEDKAYLEIRLPLIPYCSMDGVFPKSVADWTYGTEEDQIKHASICAHHLVQYWNLLRQEKLIPTQTADRKITFSMSQYRRLYNTARIPGDNRDALVSYFKTVSEGRCPSSVIVMCKGRLFITDGVDSSGNPITPIDWQDILKKIVNVCNESGDTSDVGLLTCDNRTNWSKNRTRLEMISSKNKKILELINQCLFILVLDDDSPETDTDVSNCNLCGDYRNRWSDKATSMIFYKNGRSGCVADHTSYDGIIVISCHHYLITAVEECKVDWDQTPRSFTFEELKFDVDDTLRKEIDRLKLETVDNRQEVLMTRNTFEDYGKAEMQRLKFHPDSYVQLVLQLAYCSLHGKPASCYETATTRKYFNGRTETLRPCTTQCMDWVAAMMDSQRTDEERRALFERAIKRHDELMNEARDNAGCDRHLFGMYCMALEEGIQIPELYLDPSYLKSGGGGNFVLSTSCIGFTRLGGGVAPMCVDGYGIFYNIMQNRINFTVSVNTKSKETNASEYYKSLSNSLRRTREVLIRSTRTRSKF